MKNSNDSKQFFIERRQVIKNIGSYSSLGLLGTTSIFWSHETQAFLPFLIRIFAQGVARFAASSATRSVGRYAARSVGRYAAHSAARSTRANNSKTKVPIQGINIDAGLVTSVSEEIYTLILEYGAKALWVVDSDEVQYENPFVIQGENRTSNLVEESYYFSINNLLDNEIDTYWAGIIRAYPYGSLEIKHQAPRDIKRGVVNIVARTQGESNIEFEPSPNIVIAHESEVTF